MKDNINGSPLLFIKSINDNVVPNNQTLFDSREIINNQNKKEAFHDELFYLKINRLVQMYNKGRIIICNLITTQNDSFTGQVIFRKDNIISFKNINNQVQELCIDNIQELLISSIS